MLVCGVWWIQFNIQKSYEVSHGGQCQHAVALTIGLFSIHKITAGHCTMAVWGVGQHWWIIANFRSDIDRSI